MVVYLNDGKGRLTPGFSIVDKVRTPYAMTAGGDRHPDIPVHLGGFTPDGRTLVLTTMEESNLASRRCRSATGRIPDNWCQPMS